MYGEDAIAHGGETIELVHPLTFLLLLFIGYQLLFCSKKWALTAMLCGTLLIPLTQNLQFAGLNFTIARIVILLGSFRAALEFRIQKLQLISLDIVFVFWLISNCVVYCIQWGNISAVANRSGFFIDTAGAYLFFRALCTTEQDVKNLIRSLSILTIFLAILMGIEYLTGRNLFSFFGGVPEITEVREGRLRCQGPFPHPIYSGTFGALSFGVIYWLWQSSEKSNRKLYGTAILATLIVVYTSSCSGPVLGLASSIFAVVFWRIRKHLNLLVWATILFLLLASIVMNGPIWALLGKVGIFGGSTGWHRYLLVDNAIKYFGDWALFGVKSTDYWGWGQWDVTNTYIKQGVQGGIITLILFVTIFIVAIKMALNVTKSALNRQTQKLGWCLGAVLFAHAVTFLGMDITWGSTKTIMCMFLALTVSIYQSTAQMKEPDLQNTPLFN